MPFSKRKLSYKSTFLPVSVAFHHMAMAPVVELVADDCERLGARRRRPLPLARSILIVVVSSTLICLLPCFLRFELELRRS